MNFRQLVRIPARRDPARARAERSDRRRARRGRLSHGRGAAQLAAALRQHRTAGESVSRHDDRRRDGSRSAGRRPGARCRRAADRHAAFGSRRDRPRARARLACTPGVATPSEGFAALSGGADAIKLFPAEAMPPAVVRLARRVPEGCAVPAGRRYQAGHHAGLRRGGRRRLRARLRAFTPSLSAAEVAQNAWRFAEAWRNLAADRSAPGALDCAGHSSLIEA